MSLPWILFFADARFAFPSGDPTSYMGLSGGALFDCCVFLIASSENVAMDGFLRDASAANSGDTPIQFFVERSDERRCMSMGPEKVCGLMLVTLATTNMTKQVFALSRRLERTCGGMSVCSEPRSPSPNFLELSFELTGDWVPGAGPADHVSDFLCWAKLFVFARL